MSLFTCFRRNRVMLPAEYTDDAPYHPRRYTDWTAPLLAAEFALQRVIPARVDLQHCAVGVILKHHGLPTTDDGMHRLIHDYGYPAGWVDALIAAFDGHPRVCLPGSVQLAGAELGVAVNRLLWPQTAFLRYRTPSPGMTIVSGGSISVTASLYAAPGVPA